MFSLHCEYIISIDINLDFIWSVGGCVQTNLKVGFIIFKADLLLIFEFENVFASYIIENGRKKLHKLHHQYNRVSQRPSVSWICPDG